MNKKSVDILAELEKFTRDRNPFWNISRETAETLYSLAKSVNAKNILEIGTSNGYSGIWLANACKKLYTVESHGERFEMARENFGKAGVKVRQIKGHAPEILSAIKETFDMAFIDATKYEYPLYLKAVLPKLKKGGLFVADNIDSHASSLKKFFTIIKTAEKFYIPVGTGLLVIRKV